jgi:uncharacterized protein DUF1579
MLKTGVVSFSLLALATLASRPLAAADTPSPKPAAAPAPSAAKPAAGAAPAGAKPGAAPGAAKSGAAPAPVAKVPAAPAIPTMPTPSKELELFMKAFEGNWKCETEFAAGSTGPGSPEAKGKATLKIRKEFGGFSWHGEYSLAKNEILPAMSGVFQVSYDPSSKQATFVSYDSMGAAMMGAGPLSADSVTFAEQGYMLGIKVKVHETMTRKSSKEISHKVEIDSGKTFQLMAEDTCKK